MDVNGRPWNSGPRKSSPWQEIVMQMFSAIAVFVIISNAMIFIALTFFRRERPNLRTRLFSWALHNGTRRRSTKARHSGFPA
jgi:hypothetical protein